MVRRNDPSPYWLIWRQPNGLYAIDHVNGADRIRTAEHVDHADAYRQAQMLGSASLHPIIDRND